MIHSFDFKGSQTTKGVRKEYICICWHSPLMLLLIDRERRTKQKYFQTMGMGIGLGDGEGEGLRPEFTPYYRTPRKEALQLRGETAQ